jgi:hypothetical protein
MKDSQLKGLVYAKIGAKTAGFTQPLDVGPYFRTKKMFSKKICEGVASTKPHFSLSGKVQQALESTQRSNDAQWVIGDHL